MVGEALSRHCQPMTDDLAALAEGVEAVFADIHRRVFLGDPVANPRLRVEVVDPVMVADTPTLVLITPWTLNGLAFPPDGAFPETLRVGGRQLPVFANDIAGMAPYHSVNLASDVLAVDGPASARALADTLGGPFRDAVARVRRPRLVADPSRRSFLSPWSAVTRIRNGTG